MATGALPIRDMLETFLSTQTRPSGRIHRFLNLELLSQNSPQFTQNFTTELSLPGFSVTDNTT